MYNSLWNFMEIDIHCVMTHPERLNCIGTRHNTANPPPPGLADRSEAPWVFRWEQPENRKSFGDRPKIIFMGLSNQRFTDILMTSSWSQVINPLKSWLQLLWLITVWANKLKWWVLIDKIRIGGLWVTNQKLGVFEWQKMGSMGGNA